jgi:hypothetical protein
LVRIFNVRSDEKGVFRIEGGEATEKPYQILDVSPIEDIPQLELLELRGFILKDLEGLDKLENMEGRIFVRDCVITDES